MFTVRREMTNPWQCGCPLPPLASFPTLLDLHPHVGCGKAAGRAGQEARWQGAPAKGRLRAEADLQLCLVHLGLPKNPQPSFSGPGASQPPVKALRLTILWIYHKHRANSSQAVLVGSGSVGSRHGVASPDLWLWSHLSPCREPVESRDKRLKRLVGHLGPGCSPNTLETLPRRDSRLPLAKPVPVSPYTPRLPLSRFFNSGLFICQKALILPPSRGSTRPGEEMQERSQHRAWHRAWHPRGTGRGCPRCCRLLAVSHPFAVVPALT